MAVTRLEKLVYVGCPWLFGIVMVFVGLYTGLFRPLRSTGILITGFGLICMSIYCICALLVKILEEK